ncbi:aspartate/glutamate racemase family protein [Streptomyces sp. NBC_00091]|uniref:maleate cis-trans isomerase family protein n=1 Tax=Streptomyces sp. NBC_00091 TaxID=2975648 RepID=UPI0022594570|nr:aspartate/glutamate racemase family protein [Streptomyces sp. NBC_00091]MCX5376704.1 aspartate/glutamate racemase family protein [Streptomyces sp. NBC_00091]
MWQPDGWDVRVRLGVLTPHADVGPESELRAMAPPEVGLHTARVPFAAMGPGGTMGLTVPLAPVRAFAEPPHVDDAAELLAGAPVAAIAYAFTSSAYVIGARGEAYMLDRLRERARGLPVVATCAAVVEALRLLGIGRLALVDPPWFDATLSDLGRGYYEEAGFEVPYAAPCGLPSGQALIRPEALYGWVLEQVPDGAEAVVVGGNGFRAVGVIGALEAELGRPVLTANQVLLWAALRAAGAPVDGVRGYGRLFDTP